MQVQQEDTEKQKIIDIPSPEMIDFKVKAAELKTFTKVITCEKHYLLLYFYLTLGFLLLFQAS